MAFNSNGQVSYLVLDSLSEGSKYGLEIIEYISKKTGGSYVLKKPTLYSCLTRMEKKGLVSSSYWGESELGGKRHYYTITSAGKENLAELEKEFAGSFENTEPEEEVTDDGKFLSAEEKVETQDATDYVEETTSDSSNSVDTQGQDVFLQQGNIFDMVKSEEKKTEEKKSDETQNSDVLENQLDIFSISAQSPSDEEKMEYYQSKLNQSSQPSTPEETSVQNDGRLLKDDEKYELTADQTEQNRRIYDTSSELKKYRKRKSFSENQIEMSVVYKKDDDDEIQRDRIQQLKQSMLNLKQNGFGQVNPSVQNTTSTTQPEQIFTKEENDDEFSYQEEAFSFDKNEIDETKDDAVLITNPRIEQNQIPIQRKITPPNIEINIYDDNLPAPKRDANLEPTYKDMMAKLFERKKEKKTTPEIIKEEPQNVGSFADYGSLKKYYQGHGINFNEYRKTSVERRHNTNFLTFVTSTILLLLSGIGSAILFWIISGTNNLRPSTNFMFYVIPILFFVYSLFKLIKFKVVPSKKAVLLYNSIINWAVFILGSLVVFVINIACGMQIELISGYLTSILLPIMAILIAFPVNYYIKKFTFKKFSK